MTHTPTPEQEAIVAFIRTRSENLIVDALAGAAKTSTLELCARSVPRSTLYICFNKRNAEEATARMPSHVECRTLNALGHRASGRYLGRKLTIDVNKKGRLLKAEIDRFKGQDRDELWRTFPDLCDAFREAYIAGWLPDKAFPSAKRFCTDEEFRENLELDLSDLEFTVLRRAMREAINEACNATFDFDDQILFPIAFPATFDQYPEVWGDEAQDWSMLNHEMVAKLVGKKSRLVAVGDPCQAIYAFRGAHANSMQVLRDRFQMETLHLTTSFRCARDVAEHVRWRAPSIRSPEWAKPGRVQTLPQWTADTLPDSAAIICRNNAPIMGMAMKLLRAGRRPEVRGNDITKGLVKAMKKLGDPLMTQEDALTAWTLEAKRLRVRHKNSNFINDKIDCVEYFIRDQETLGLAIARAEQIMNLTGPLQLMTGHKSKGLEFNDVFFLDSFLLKDEGQDLNLKYVICTRAQENLYYVTSQGYEGEIGEAA